MLGTAVLLLLAFAVVTIVSPVVSLAVLFLVLPLRRLEGLRSLLAFFVNGIAMFVAMLGFGWLATKIGRSPGVWFYLIPFLAVFVNDLRRLSNAHTGRTRAKRMLEAGGETYRPEVVGQQELAATLGNVAGYWVAFLVNTGDPARGLPTLLFFLGLVALWAYNYNRGHPKFWHLVADHADEFFDWIRNDDAWFILDSAIGLPTIPEPRGEWVGPLFLWIPKLGNRKIQFYGRAGQMEQSQFRFLESVGIDADYQERAR